MPYINCKNCVNDDCSLRGEENETCCSDYKQKPITQADNIRGMTDEELAGRLDKILTDCESCPCYENSCSGYTPDCVKLLLAWLRSPAEERKDDDKQRSN